MNWRSQPIRAQNLLSLTNHRPRNSYLYCTFNLAWSGMAWISHPRTNPFVLLVGGRGVPVFPHDHHDGDVWHHWFNIGCFQPGIWSSWLSWWSPAGTFLEGVSLQLFYPNYFIKRMYSNWRWCFFLDAIASLDWDYEIEWSSE